MRFISVQPRHVHAGEEPLELKVPPIQVDEMFARAVDHHHVAPFLDRIIARVNLANGQCVQHGAAVEEVDV